MDCWGQAGQFFQELARKQSTLVVVIDEKYDNDQILYL